MSLLFLEDHVLHVAFFHRVSHCPLDSEQRRLEELLVSVLLEYVLLGESVLCKFLHEHRVARKEMFFREAGMINEGFVLEKTNNRS